MFDNWTNDHDNVLSLLIDEPGRKTTSENRSVVMDRTSQTHRKVRGFFQQTDPIGFQVDLIVRV